MPENGAKIEVDIKKLGRGIVAIIIGLQLSLDIVLLIFGGMHLDECTIGVVNIPLVNFIAGYIGAVGYLSTTINFELNYHHIPYIAKFCIAVEFLCVLIGSIEVYRLYKPNFDKDRDPHSYCNDIVYWSFFVCGIIYFTLQAMTWCVHGCVKYKLMAQAQANNIL